ncbi:MAG: ABC transporter substrate-binding protein [Blastopirellula sp.]|nr:MAG: ABC transporter substrate-binding protein [Blastopirellula sp.]
MKIPFQTTLAALATVTLIFVGSGVAFAADYTINVWSGGTGPNDTYRIDAIKIAAGLLEAEAGVRGEELNITVEGKAYDGWEEFKQAITLSAEAGNAPHIVVSGHEDIAAWAQSGLLVPIENYVDLDSWPINDIYDNLLKFASFEGTLYGLPQDAESRPFFFWRAHMKSIGYSDAQIDALPGDIQSGAYTLSNVLEDAKKIQDAGLVEAGYGFYPRASNGPDYWQFYLSFGGEMEDGKGKLVFDKAAMTGFYQFFVDAVASGVTKKNHLGMNWDQWYGEVANGKAGIWHGGTWHYKRYTTKEGNDDFFGTIQFSLIPGGGSNSTANTITHPLVYLLTKQKNDDATAIAAELIKIASGPRINALHAIKSAHLGISKAEESVDLYSGDRWAREATERLLPHASAMPNNVNFGQYWEIMFGGLEASWTGQKTVGEAIDDVESELTTTLGDKIIMR